MKEFYNNVLCRSIRDEELSLEELRKSTAKMIRDIQMKTGSAYTVAEIEFFAVRELWEKMNGVSRS